MKEKAYYWQLLGLAEERHPKLFEKPGPYWRPSDLDTVGDFIFSGWAGLDPRTRSNIQGDWSAQASRFLYNPYRETFCSGHSDFTLEQTYTEGKVIICDYPILEFNQTGRIIAALMKLLFYRTMLRRD